MLLALCLVFQSENTNGQICPPKTVPYLETFNSYPGPDLPPCSDSLDIDGDGLNWEIENNTSSTGEIFLRFQRKRAGGINESWYFMEGIELEQNITYTFRCLWITDGRKATPRFRLHVARDKSVDSMMATPALFDNNNVVQASFDTLEVDFTPTVSGVYYFGFYGHADDALTQGMNISIDDIVVRKKGTLLHDAAIVSIAGMTENGSLCADNNADVHIILSNEAILPVKDVLLDFTYTGPSTGARSNTVSDPIEMGDSETITFSGVDLSQVGSYDFEAVIYMPGDEVSANDTLRFTVDVVDQDPQADSMIITAQGGMNFDFDVANPQDAYGYTWDFGDGTNGSGKQLSHTYTTPGQYTVTLTLENGCGTETLTQTLVVEDETDKIADAFEAQSYRIFPNPTNNYIFIQNPAKNGSLNYTVYNSHGQLMTKGIVAVDATNSIKTYEWSQGIYFLHIQHGDAVRVHKLQVVQ